MAILGIKLEEKYYYKLIYSKITFIESNKEIDILDIIYDQVLYSDEELESMIKIEYTDLIKKKTKTLKLKDFYDDYLIYKFKLKGCKGLIIGLYDDDCMIFIENVNYKTIKRLTRLYKKLEKEYISFKVLGCGHCD